MEGVELEFRPDALTAIARKALKRKTGARGLRTIVESGAARHDVRSRRACSSRCVLAAVEARHRTGRGQRVETSLLEAATSFCVYEAAHYFAMGTRPPRIGQQHRGSSPDQVFATADRWITIGVEASRRSSRNCA